MWILFGILSALATTSTNSVRKRETIADHVDVINLATFAFAIPVLLLANLYFGFPQVPASYWIYLVGHLGVDVIAFSFFVRALQAGQISLVTPFVSFVVIFIAFISPFTLGEQITPAGFLGITICVLGAYLINVSKGNKGILQPVRQVIHNKGIKFALGAALFWSFGAQFLKAGQSVTTPWFHPLMLACGLAVLFAIIVMVKDKLHLVEQLRHDLPGHAALGVSFALEVLFLSVAVSIGYVAYAVALKQLSLIFDVIAGKLFFGEDHYMQRILSGLIIFTGVIIIVIWG